MLLDRCLSDCLPVLSVCPVLSVLSVTLVYCGQTVGWINMKLGTQVGFGPGHIVLYAVSYTHLTLPTIYSV